MAAEATPIERAAEEGDGDVIIIEAATEDEKREWGAKLGREVIFAVVRDGERMPVIRPQTATAAPVRDADGVYHVTMTADMHADLTLQVAVYDQANGSLVLPAEVGSGGTFRMGVTTERVEASAADGGTAEDEEGEAG